MFEAKTIRRMELLVLQTLEWKMQALTPCSFIDYFLSKINGDKHLSTSPFPRSVQLILNTIKSLSFAVLFMYLFLVIPCCFLVLMVLMQCLVGTECRY